MVTLSSDSRPIIGRGPPLGARFFFLAVFSIVIMVLDQRGGYLKTTRYWLGIAANPLYSVVQAPFDLWYWLTGSVTDRGELRIQNDRLTQELRVARVKLLRFDSLNEENRRLRAIRTASQGIAERTLIAEIINVDVDPFRHRVRINKGSADGVFTGQSVLDAFGIVGQITQVDRSTAEIILISDNEHAIPVQVNRNGIRSIAVGIGDIHRLSLPFLTIESDVKPDDLLVSSGLDGIFPAGYPVARILKVERNPAETFAVVEARPMAQLDRAREVLLLWFEKSTDGTGSVVGPAATTAPPAQAGNQQPAQKPEQKTEQKAGQKVGQKVDETPGQPATQTRKQTPGQTSGQTPGATPAQRPATAAPQPANSNQSTAPEAAAPPTEVPTPAPPPEQATSADEAQTPADAPQGPPTQ
jgi:rod shape-determining protein MreC